MEELNTYMSHADYCGSRKLYYGKGCAVLEVNRQNYSQEEVEDWTSCGDNLSKIGKMIDTHYFIVAVNQLLQTGLNGLHQK